MLHRQGDVLIVKVDALPPNARQVKGDRIVLAEGEATGHAHTMTVDTAAGWKVDDALWVVVDEPTELTHEEHDTIVVEPGIWQVVRQREYTPAAPRWVAD